MKFTQNTEPTEIEISDAKGCFVTDKAGNRFLDISSQTFNTILGHGDRRLHDVVHEQIDRVAYLSSRFANEAAMSALTSAEGALPRHLERLSFKMASGSMANEHAVKAAWANKNDGCIVSLKGGYHGQSIVTMALSERHKDRRYLPSANVRRVCSPAGHVAGCGGQDCSQCLDDFFQALVDEGHPVAAVIAEPIMVEAGIFELSGSYLAKLGQWSGRLQFAVIFDEVQTGGGWLESFSYAGSKDLGNFPDIVTLGKAISAGFPLAAIALKREYDLLGYGEHEFTYGGFLPSLVAFSHVVQRHHDAVKSGSFVELSGSLELALRQLARRFEAVHDVRGNGLIWGVEFGHPRDKSPKDLQKLLNASGIIGRFSNIDHGTSVLKIKVPLIADDEVLSNLESRLASFMSAIS